MSQLEYCPCPLCYSHQAENYLLAPDRFALAEEETYSLQRCLQCGMIYLNPRPREEESGRFYQHAEYLPFASTTGAQSLTEKLYAALRRLNLRWKRNLLSRFHHGGALLDVGCGTGEFLAFMHEAGWQVRGLERDAHAAEYGREHLGLAIQTGSVNDLPNEAQRYAVITMWHVLEHIYDFHAALKLLASRLQDDGVLIVAVPNIASFDAKFYREHWIALDAPRHVNHFSLTTLASAAAAHQLHLLWWQQLPLDAFFNAMMSERLQAVRHHCSSLLLPFRLLRAGCVACASLLAGSRTPFGSAQSGATIVAVLRKVKTSS